MITKEEAIKISQAREIKPTGDEDFDFYLRSMQGSILQNANYGLRATYWPYSFHHVKDEDKEKYAKALCKCVDKLRDGGYEVKLERGHENMFFNLMISW